MSAEQLNETAQVEQLAHDLLRAKHDDNPDAPFPMVRSGCALVLAEALYDLGWRRVISPTEPTCDLPFADGYTCDLPRGHS